MSDLSLDNVVTNDMNFKHLETTKDITISIKNENGFPQRPDATHTWTAKVSDGTNYVGDYAVKIDQTSLIVDSGELTKLPTGSYQLEVWEEWNDPDGTKQRSIYPSPSQTIPFTIYANITDQAEKEIKSIGFQDVVDQAVMNIGMNYVFKVNTIEPDQTATVVQSAADGKNYVTFNIPRGAKGDQGNVGPAPTLKIGTVTKLNSDQTPTANVSGDNGAYTLDLGIPQGSTGATGTVDNDGLISAPAFQSLQTQVNNSSVGANLLVGTAKFNPWNGSVSYFPTGNLGLNIALEKDSDGDIAWHLSGTVTIDGILGCYSWQLHNAYPSTYAFSASVKGTFANTSLSAFKVEGSSNNVVSINWSSTYSRWVSTGNIASGQGGGAVLYFKMKSGDTVDIWTKKWKLEKGSVATPWCPNPTEILTQSDYAKIKAAIVALGGSLS